MDARRSRARFRHGGFALGVVSFALALALGTAAAFAAWHQPVGGPSPINVSPTRSAQSPSLASIAGVPYIAWAESDGVTTKMRVARLNAADLSVEGR